MVRKTLMIAALVGAAFPAIAGLIPDQITTSSGQLASFVGTFTPDINIVSAGAEFDGANFTFEVNVAGAVGTNPNAAYVFGINTGTNLAAFAPFMIGEDNVLFDTAVVLQANGGPSLVFDVLTNSVENVIPSSDVTFHGDTIDAVIPKSLIASLGGFSPGQYQVDLWTRVGLNGADKTQLADFAPNNMDIPFETPEPASVTLFGLGLAGVVALARRRRA